MSFIFLYLSNYKLSISNEKQCRAYYIYRKNDDDDDYGKYLIFF